MARLGSKIISAVVAVAAAVMVLALGFVFWRRRRMSPAAATASGAAERPVDALIRELATMDAEFEQRVDATAEDRVAYDARRNQLKAQLNAALAAEKGAT